MHPIAPQMETMRTNIIPCQKTNSSGHNQQHYNNVNQRIGNVRCQRWIEVAGTSQNVKTGIAECGNRMEYRHPNPPRAIITAENRQHGQRAQQLNKKCSFQNKPRQANDTADRRRRDCVLHGAALFQRDVFAGKHQECCRHSDDAEAADLNQKQDNALPKDGPVASAVKNNQAGNANRRGGGKQ